MDDNGMLFTVFQNRMHLARDFLNAPGIRDFFWEKKSLKKPGPSSLVVMCKCLARIRVSRKRSLGCFLAPLKRKMLVDRSLEFGSNNIYLNKYLGEVEYLDLLKMIGKQSSSNKLL